MKLKTLTMSLTLTALILTFANLSQACQIDAETLEKASLSLAKLNNPDGELTAKLVSSKGSVYKVIIDDTYGVYKTTIKTALSGNGKFCRIKSISEE